MRHLKLFTIALLVTASAGYASGGSALSPPGVETATVELKLTNTVFPYDAQPVVEQTVLVVNNPYAFTSISIVAVHANSPLFVVASNGPDIGNYFLNPSSFNLKAPLATRISKKALFYARSNYLSYSRQINQLIKYKPDKRNC